MSWSSPAREHQSYRHEAFLWGGAEDFTAGLVPFLEEGLEAGEPMMVAVGPEHTSWLREALGAAADTIRFVDMHQLGRNPARIIPAWQRFLDEEAAGGRPVRGVGEPIWPGRRAEELLECQLHEALLNVAVDPELPFWLICPYDTAQLSEAVIEEAFRSHPVLVEAGGYSGSAGYGGRAHVDSLFSSDLSAPAGQVRQAHFTAADVGRLLSYTRLEFYVAGLSLGRAADLAHVVERLAASSLHRGSGGGTVTIWSQPGGVVCEVADDVPVEDPLAGRRPPAADDHDALWVANQLCDLVQLRSTVRGTAVRVHAWTS
ncbi:MEDS: MEthanogen/methylotroph, DcmR Sensory domain [Friedmanniella luteola]|uniref:MEDS: MEthanogen/methylotroph, DcmR Sensory domain n=1 Tax=Friedmanniella luteola TaxID=546871 RepID=A0A1H1ZK92_9ACTN|nr:sensor histidine kinase [Friedmanniella luteola]SDT34148.1 MEDS: MEthanogen/methylotroph, DcmR Sensory domain [Friedmanniella luteola]